MRAASGGLLDDFLRITVLMGRWAQKKYSRHHAELLWSTRQEQELFARS
jgi:hypothetical protein